MPTPVLDQQDFMLIPLLNLLAEPVAGDVTPSAANTGRLFRNVTTGRLRYVRDATTIVSLDIQGLIANGDIAAGAAIALSKLATDPLARGNHTGQQAASTISDFNTAVRTNKVHELALATAALPMNGQKITGLGDGTAASDAAAWGQVQNLISSTVNGQDWKGSVRAAVTTNVNIASPGASMDGIAAAGTDRYLLTGQTNGAENGIWVWNGAATAMTRATDADASTEINSGLTVPIESGTNADKLAILTTDGAITLGTTPIAFTFLSGPTAYTSGSGISIVGNVISISAPISVAMGGTGATDAATARNNLGVSRRGVELAVPAFGAGATINIAHGMATDKLNVDVRRLSDGKLVRIGIAVDTVNVMINADVAVAANTLVAVVNPVVS